MSNKYETPETIESDAQDELKVKHMLDNMFDQSKIYKCWFYRNDIETYYINSTNHKSCSFEIDSLDMMLYYNTNIEVGHNLICIVMHTNMIKYDLYRAISFGIDHNETVKQIFIAFIDPINNEINIDNYKRFIQEFEQMKERIRNVEHHIKMSIISDYFQLGTRPFISHKFHSFLENVHMNIFNSSRQCIY